MGMNVTTTSRPDDTIYRSPDGQRWRIVGEGKDIEIVRVKDGRRSILFFNKREDLVEESEWLKNNNPATIKKKKR